MLRANPWSEEGRKNANRYRCVNCGRYGSILEAGTWYCSDACHDQIRDRRAAIEALNAERRTLKGEGS